MISEVGLKMDRKFFLKRIAISYIILVLSLGLPIAIADNQSLSTTVANAVDKTTPYKKMKLSEKIASGVQARILSVLLYPVYALTDALYLIPKSSLEWTWGALSKGASATEWYDAAARDISLARRSLVGFITSPSGLISPDYITRHFVNHRKSNSTILSGGGYYAKTGTILYPLSIKHIQEIVSDANENDQQIAIVGSGLSQGSQFLPLHEGNIVLDLQNLKEVKVDSENKIAIVQAGATWRDVQEAVNPHGLSVQVMQASNVFTIGGSLSVNCHGWDHRMGTVGQTVNAVTIVDCNGMLKRLTPQDPEFHYVIGGYGLFGVIVQAELALTDNIELVDEGKVIPFHDYVNYFYKDVLPNEAIKMHLLRLSLDPDHLLSEGIAQNYIAISKNEVPVVSDLRDEPEIGSLVHRVGVHSARKLNYVRRLFWMNERRSILTPKLTTRNEAMRAPINAIFSHSVHDTEWLQEFFVPGAELESFITKLGSLLTRYKVCLINASVRFVKANDVAALDYTNGEDRFAVVLCFNQLLNDHDIELAKEWIKGAIDLALSHGGSYYLPYQHFAEQKQFQQAYPKFCEFLQIKKKFDPNELFASQFFGVHRGLCAPITKDVKKVETSIEAYQLTFGDIEHRREFRKFLRNIFLSLNEDAFMKEVERHLPDFKNYEELYKYLQDNVSKMQPRFLARNWRAIQSLRGEKADCASQIKKILFPKNAFDGYVEIGFPGRMINSICNLFEVKGPIYVVNTDETLLDYLQCGFPRPYNHFVPLKNYTSLTESIDEESVDLVSCLIGLHHCPPERLDSFVASIAKVLRPGGVFLLRDHDATNPDHKAFAHLAHSVFNLGTGVPWDGLGSGLDESSEIRNFQSLAYWDALLEKHGLIRDKNKEPLFRPGDPTKNALLRYEKLDEKKQIATQNSEGHRKQLQTFMTSVEWLSVHVSQDYAAFIEHTPFYMYPYFSDVKNFWKVLGFSWKEAKKYHSAWEILSSDYFLMNSFIVFFHTVEFTLKGLITWPIAAIYQSNENLEPNVIRLVVEDPNQEISSFLDRGVKIISSNSAYEIEMPRYLPFRDLLVAMTEKGIQPQLIAGQEHIQVQCVLQSAQSSKLEELPGCCLIGSFQKPIDPSQMVVYLNVRVNQLHLLLPELQKRGIEIVYVHDF